MSNDSVFEDFIQEVTSVSQIKISGSASQSIRGSGRLKTTCQQVKNNPHKPSPFSKLFDLGSHRVAHNQIFNRATRILMLIVGNSTFGGRCYMSVRMIADELSCDEANVRKIIKQLEDEDFVLKVDADPTAYWITNPYYFFVGDSESEEIAKRVWSSKKTKRITEQRKKKALA